MNDKINHLFAGAVVALVVGFIPYLATGHLGVCLWAAMSSGVIAAVALVIIGLHFGEG